MLQHEKDVDNPRDTRQLIALALQATSKDASSYRRERLIADTKGYYQQNDFARAKAAIEPIAKRSGPTP